MLHFILESSTFVTGYCSPFSLTKGLTIGIKGVYNESKYLVWENIGSKGVIAWNENHN